MAQRDPDDKLILRVGFVFACLTVVLLIATVASAIVAGNNATLTGVLAVSCVGALTVFASAMVWALFRSDRRNTIIHARAAAMMEQAHRDNARFIRS